MALKVIKTQFAILSVFTRCSLEASHCSAWEGLIVKVTLDFVLEELCEFLKSHLLQNNAYNSVYNKRAS